MAEGIFPIVDRDTPVIDRIRERRQNGAESEDSPITTAESVAESLTSSGKEREQIRNRLALTLQREMADEIGVEKSMIRETIPSELASLATSYEVEEVLTDDAMEELGLTGTSLEELGEAEEVEEDGEDDTEDSDSDDEKF